VSRSADDDEASSAPERRGPVKATVERNARVITLNLLRVVAGFLFWQHGAQKLFGWLGGRQVESLASLSGIAGVLEFFGGLLIIVGLFTRPVAFVLAGEMAVAYFLRHAPDGLWPIMNRGELSALYSFLFMFFAAHGGGHYSLDGLRRGNASAGD
jgi:putative oxidoreductase